MNLNDMGTIESIQATINEINSCIAGEQEGDYTGEDGLVYCGNCHTKKQARIDTHIKELGDKGVMVVGVCCKCRKEQIEREEEERVQRDKLYKERIKLSFLKSISLIDDKFRDSRLENFSLNNDNARVNRIIRRYIERFPEMTEKNQGLLFYGSPGTGKSFAAACIANALLDKETPVMMTSFSRLIDMIRPFGSEEETESGFISALNDAHLLVIDDLGAERDTNYALEKVYNVIDSRYRVKRPLILTTNLTLTQMQDTTDIRYKRIYDRVFEMCYPVEFKGQSWRYDKARTRYDEISKVLLED